MYDGLTLFRPGFIDYCNAWQVRFWVCCALDPLRNVIAKRVCLFASVNGSRDRLWLVCTQYEAESFRVLFMAAQQQVSAWVGERLCGLGDHWRGTACHTRRSARHVCHLYTVLELTSKNWGSAAEMFEILPRDWSFWLIFTQKWASVDMNWEGVNPQLPDNSNPGCIRLQFIDGSHFITKQTMFDLTPLLLRSKVSEWAIWYRVHGTVIIAKNGWTDRQFRNAFSPCGIEDIIKLFYA